MFLSKVITKSWHKYSINQHSTHMVFLLTVYTLSRDTNQMLISLNICYIHVGFGKAEIQEQREIRFFISPNVLNLLHTDLKQSTLKCVFALSWNNKEGRQNCASMRWIETIIALALTVWQNSISKYTSWWYPLYPKRDLVVRDWYTAITSILNKLCLQLTRGSSNKKFGAAVPTFTDSVKVFVAKIRLQERFSKNWILPKMSIEQ